MKETKENIKNLNLGYRNTKIVEIAEYIFADDLSFMQEVRNVYSITLEYGSMRGKQEIWK